jgi:FkbM family methyltransferase
MEIQSARRTFATVRIMPFGLSDTNGTAPISDDANGHLSRIVNAGMPNSTLATVRRLDDLDIPLPDLIKIDVEDHERAVLEGAASVIKTSQPAFPAAACNIFACPKDRLTAWLS